MTAIASITENEVSIVEKVYDKVGDYLDKHPTIYKVVLVGCHFFRTITMFAAMVYLPLPAAATAVIMVGGTFLYRAAVERFCCFRFAIPSLVGAGAAWAGLAATVNFVSGAALASVGMIVVNSLAFLPVLGYTAWVIYLSHRDIENRMKKIGEDTANTGCCPCEG